MKNKRSSQAMLILLILTLRDKFDILLQWWLLIRSKFSRFFPIERLDPTDKIWLVLIICLTIIISQYHLVSLHKNRDHYLLAVSHWLCKYICKSSIWNLGPLPLLQVFCWNTNSTCARYYVTDYTCYHVVHVIMSEHVILELVNSVSNLFNMINFC